MRNKIVEFCWGLWCILTAVAALVLAKVVLVVWGWSGLLIMGLGCLVIHMAFRIRTGHWLE